MQRKIFIQTQHAGKSFCAKVYLDRGLPSYLLIDRQIDYFSFRKYEWADRPEMALRIEYTAYYNAIQVVLNRLVHNAKITPKMAERGLAEWLGGNPIPEDLPHTRLSTAFCPLPIPASSPKFTEFEEGQSASQEGGS
jgi:hypothetical protein